MKLLQKVIIKDGEKDSAVSYLINYKGKMSNNGSYFYTLYLKCGDGSVINGYLFNVDKLEESGLILSKLKRKPVLIEFVGNIYNEYKSIVVKEITPFTEVISLKPFLGGVEGCKESLTRLDEKLTTLGYTESSLMRGLYCSVSFLDICGGREGGYCILMERVFDNCFHTINLMSEEDRLLFCSVFVGVFENYFNYLVKAEDLDILPNSIMFDILNSIFIISSNQVSANIIMEILLSLNGSTSPQHLFSHLIVSSLKCNKIQLDLYYKNKELPFASSCKVGDLTLAKY